MSTSAPFSNIIILKCDKRYMNLYIWKELDEAVRNQTNCLQILGSNSLAVTISP